jgi:hypothetical protein
MSAFWIRVAGDLARRKVTYRVMHALGVSKHEAMGLLVEFWANVAEHCTGGYVADVSDMQLDAWADWRGEPGAFASFVRANHLDADGRVNEWEEYAGKLEQRREADRLLKEAERQQRGADRARARSTPSAGRHADVEVASSGERRDVQRMSAGLPQAVRTDSVPARANETRTKRDYLPPAPPLGAQADSPPAATVRALKATADEQRVLDAYKAAHPLSRPGSEAHVRLIRRHLRDGYAADELIEAVQGNVLDAWAVQKGKHELAWVLRNRDNIDRYRAEYQRQNRPATNGLGELTEETLRLVRTS